LTLCSSQNNFVVLIPARFEILRASVWLRLIGGCR
jgi:hypothetical protein